MVLLVLVTLLLPGPIWQTARGDVEAFKSDSMATLFVGLDETKRSAIGVVQSVNYTESSVEQTRERPQSDDADGQSRLMKAQHL